MPSIRNIMFALLGATIGVAVTAQKKDRVILGLQKRNTRLSSWEHVSGYWRDGYRLGHNRGWLDRNMDSRTQYQFPQFN